MWSGNDDKQDARPHWEAYNSQYEKPKGDRKIVKTGKVFSY
jgi:hypothetical protein